MNNVSITGRLTTDPMTKEAGTQEVTRFRIAIDNGPNPATFVDCEAWGRLGAAIAARSPEHCARPSGPMATASDTNVTT